MADAEFVRIDEVVERESGTGRHHGCAMAANSASRIQCNSRR